MIFLSVWGNPVLAIGGMGAVLSQELPGVVNKRHDEAQQLELCVFPGHLSPLIRLSGVVACLYLCIYTYIQYILFIFFISNT